MNKLVPIEFKKQRILTTKQLAEIYECNETQIQQNFNNHLDKFAIDKHYFLLQGEELREFKRNIDNIEVAPNVNKLYLWTERGANRHCKILDTDRAWEQFDNLEETYFSIKENKPTCIEDVLIQSLQEMKDMKYQLAAVKQENKETKEEVQAIRDTVIVVPDDWRDYCVKTIRTVAYKNKLAYDQVMRESYEALTSRAGCDLERRLKGRKERAEQYGTAKSKIDKLNYLDCIGDDKKLIEIYLAIVKEMAIKYKGA